MFYLRNHIVFQMITFRFGSFLYKYLPQVILLSPSKQQDPMKHLLLYPFDPIIITESENRH